MSRIRDMKRRARGDLHQEMSVPSLYLSAPNATPIPCTVRVWTKRDAEMVGALSGLPGAAERAEPVDRIRFDLSEFQALPKRPGVVSVEAGEAYRIDLCDPADLGYMTARVTRLSASEADGLPVPD